MANEEQLIERIALALGTRRRSRSGARGVLRLGIGDDAALIAPNRNTELVLSCDASLEGVHFLADVHPPDSVGYKALARATSDLAAMGATPRFFMLSLALPASRSGKWLDGCLAGLRRAAREFDMALVGGDTTKSPRAWMSVTVIGETTPGLAVTRSGARPGDSVYVSGVLGAAQLGLLLVKNGASAKGSLGLALKAHLYPRIRVNLGAFLSQRRIASVMIDLSDGLSTDLGRLCAASKVGARIDANRIPCVRIPAEDDKSLARLRLNPLKLALDGGEDYELLFTAPVKNEQRLREAPGFGQLRKIGEIVQGRRITLIDADGRERPLVPGGWDPFRNK